MINAFFGLTPCWGWKERLCAGDTICMLTFCLHIPSLPRSALLPVSLLSLPASLLFCFPPHSLLSLPIVDKSAAHIAREQLVSAISNHYCTSQSPPVLQPIFLCARHSNPHCYWRCPGTPTLKPPQSLFYILSLFCIC